MDKTAMPAPSRIWDTSDVPAGEAFDYYRGAMCEVFSPVVPTVEHEARARFHARVEATITGAGYVNRVQSTTHRVARTAREIARGNVDWHYLFYDPRGRGIIHQNGAEVAVRRGDIVVFSGAHPFALAHVRDPRLSVFSFMVPGAFLRQRLSGEGPMKPETVSDHPVFGALIRDCVRLLTGEPGKLASAARAVMFDTLFELVGLALAPRPQEEAVESPSRALFTLVSNHLEREFRDPDLGAARLASRHGITPRYVHKLFERHGDGRTLSDRLRDHRLAWAAEQIRTPAGRHATVAEIAFAAGFSDLSQFYRAFRRRYGTPPGRFRAS